LLTNDTDLSLTELVRQRIPDDDWSEENFHASVQQALEKGDFRLVIAVNGITESLKKILEYLNTRGSVRIEALELQQFTHGDNEVLVPEIYGIGPGRSTIQQGKAPRRKDPSLSDLLGMAAAKTITSMVESFRALVNGNYVSEGSTSAYGGSLRYWRKNTEGKSITVFGVNISGQRRTTPLGQLDIWIPKSALGQVLDLPEQQTKDLLMKLPVLEMFATDYKDDCIVRLENQQAADSTAKLLQDWFEKYPGYYKNAVAPEQIERIKPRLTTSE